MTHFAIRASRTDRSPNRWRKTWIGLSRLGVCALVSGPLLSAAATAAAAKEAKDGRTFALVQSLVHEVGPRFAGSEGDLRAVAWAVRTGERLGFDRVLRETVEVPRWVRGEAAVELRSPWVQPLVAVSLGGSVGTPPEGIEADVVAALDTEELSKLPEERVRGRIVFLSKRMERSADGSGYGKTVGNRSRGAIEAAKKGAVAVLIRSVGTSSARFAHTGAMRYEEGVPRIPALALANVDADLLEAALASGKPTRVLLRSSARSEGTAESANVLLEVRGRERPEEIVLLAAHLDSWDVGPSANDDAAGVAIVLEAARRLLELPERPRRTVRVVLFANEEFGLSGARAYGETHREELGRHVGALEADLGSGGVRAFRVRVSEADRPGVLDLARQLEAKLGIPFEAAPARGGADIGGLARFGVPLFDLAPDATHYFDVHHTANDTLATIDREGLEHQMEAFFEVARWLAERPEPLGRVAPEPARAGPGPGSD